jgi:hypothetical protein
MQVAMKQTASLLILFVLTACASSNSADAIATGVAQAEQLSQLETAAAIPSTTGTPTAGVSATPTVNPNYDWTGDWSQGSNSIRITQTGKQISGVLYSDSDTITFLADLIKDNQIAVGRMSYASIPGFYFFFQWRINPADNTQFQGSFFYPGSAEPFSICAVRDVTGDEPYPEPCNWP